MERTPSLSPEAVVKAPLNPRQCGQCSLCCKLLSVPVLDKPGGQWCIYCKPQRNGCSIYDHRPDVCRTFACQWLKDLSFDANWYPLKARMFLYIDGSVRPYVLRIVSDLPGRWREPPYWARIEQLAAEGLAGQTRFDTVVQHGHRFWLILPGKEIELELPNGHH
jgi:Putative zinc- or iron-chelating domain